VIRVGALGAALLLAVPAAAEGGGALLLREPMPDPRDGSALIPFRADLLGEPPVRLSEGATLLHIVAAAGRETREIEALLLTGENPSATDVRGRTPLHVAAARPDGAPVAAALVAAGAPLDARDARGRSPLHLAASPATAALLLDAGADACAEDAEGRRALSLRKLNAMVGAVHEDAYRAAAAAHFECYR